MFLTPIETLHCARSWGGFTCSKREFLRELSKLFKFLRYSHRLISYGASTHFRGMFLRYKTLATNDAKYRPRGVSGESHHYGYTGSDHHFRIFNVTNLTPILT
jgi:hypothetical protein